MKDLPHHMKKLNRQVIRSIHHEEMEDANFESKLPSPPNRELTPHQIKKQAKAKEAHERLSRKPIHKTEEERNQEMKHRTPIFDRTSHPRPKGTKASHKKTPSLSCALRSNSPRNTEE